MDEVVFQRAARRDRTLDEREIGFLHRLRGELRAQVFERRRRARDEDEPRRVGVDAVERARHQGPVPKGRAFGITRDDAVHERGRLGARQRLHGLARRLVERKERVVREDGVEADRGVGRHRVVGGLGKRGDGDRLAAFQLEPFDGGAAVHRPVAVLDRLAHERAGGRGEE